MQNIPFKTLINIFTAHFVCPKRKQCDKYDISSTFITLLNTTEDGT